MFRITNLVLADTFNSTSQSYYTSNKQNPRKQIILLDISQAFNKTLAPGTTTQNQKTTFLLNNYDLFKLHHITIEDEQNPLPGEQLRSKQQPITVD